QLLHQLAAEPLDVHGTARGKVQQRLHELCATHECAAAAQQDLALLALYRRSTHRALRGCHDVAPAGIVIVSTDGDDLGNHVTGTAHDDLVTDAHAEARHFVHVVQRGVADRDATNKHRLQARHRRQGTGAAHLEFDVEQPGGDFL